MCPGCWRPAGQGACPPCPLGTPRILRNVRVCVRALDSFKGKSLALCRIPYQPLRLAAGWDLGGGVHRDPRPRAALQRVPSFGEELWAEVTGQAGESAPPGFRSHPESLNPRSRPGTLQVPHLPACSATLRLLTRNVGTPRRAVQRRPRGSPCPSSPTQGSLRGRTWLGRHTSPGTVGQSGMFVGVQSNKIPHSGRPRRMNADGQNAGRTPPTPNHGRCPTLHSPLCRNGAGRSLRQRHPEGSLAAARLCTKRPTKTGPHGERSV